MVFLTHVYSTGRMDIEMSDTPFYLKISFRGEDASRWASVKYTMMNVVSWKVSDAFDRPMSVREKIDKIRESINHEPGLKFDAGFNAIVANIAPHVNIPLTQIIKQPQLENIAEESDESWSDISVELEPPKFVIADCSEVHVRCQDDVHEIVDLIKKVQDLSEENDFLRSIIFRR